MATATATATASVDLGFHRTQSAVEVFERRGDPLERCCGPPLSLGLGFGLPIREAAVVAGGLRFLELDRMLGQFDRRPAVADGGEVMVEQKLYRRRSHLPHLNRSALRRCGSSKS